MSEKEITKELLIEMCYDIAVDCASEEELEKWTSENKTFQQILENQKIVDKAIHLLISDTKGLALEYLNQLFWYYTGDKRKSESDQNWLIEYKNDIKEFRKILFKIVNERITGKDIKKNTS